MFVSVSGESTEIEILKSKSSTPCPNFTKQNPSSHLKTHSRFSWFPYLIPNSSLNSVDDSSWNSSWICLLDPSSLPSSWSRIPSRSYPHQWSSACSLCPHYCLLHVSFPLCKTHTFNEVDHTWKAATSLSLHVTSQAFSWVQLPCTTLWNPL